jgi:nucleolar protein 58
LQYIASGLGENASMAGRKETASEMKADKNPYPLHMDVDDEEDEDALAQLFLDNGDDEERCAADLFGNCGVISVLFETPSGFTPYGFAIFDYDAVKLTEPDAWQHIWADFVNVQYAVIWAKAFKTFEYKRYAINKNSVSPDLSSMIQKHVVNGQTLAVGNEDYKNVIQDRLRISCVYSRVVKELMWGLMIQIQHFLPVINSQMINEDRFPMSEGMIFLLEHHNFDINPHMMVTKRIIEMAGILYECDRCVKKYDTFLRLAAQHLMKISRINTSHWDLMKLATAFKMICDPEDEISDARRLFSEQLLKRLARDAPRYQDKILKDPYSEVYKEMFSARKMRLEAGRVLVSLLKRAKKAYDDEQAGKAASDHEIGPDRKKICRGFVPELTEWHTVLSEKT